MWSYLGQNFLIDSQIQTSIISHLCQIRDQYDCRSILEIGPGKGALTQHIAHEFEYITVIEKDHTLEKYLTHLSRQKHITTVYQDILTYDLTSIALDTIIYGSLPYYITSPIIQKFFVAKSYQHGCFIVQKEFGEKIASKGKHKSYLWRLLNYRYHVEYVQTIWSSAFSPPPKVQSCVITIHTKPALFSPEEFEASRVLIEALGKFKRKTLSKSFKFLGWELINIGSYRYRLPSYLAHRRLEECDYTDIFACIDKK